MLSLGAHWALLQTVAWTGMVVSYSRDGFFAEAVSQTFDGKHPCRLCEVIQQGREEEKEQDQQRVKPVSILVLGIVWQSTNFDFSCDGERIPAPDSQALARRDEPPKPRPRHVLPGQLA
jgi:hypothetical protein